MSEEYTNIVEKKNAKIKKYVKLIWENVLLYSLIDLITAVILVCVLFLCAYSLVLMFKVNLSYVHNATIIISFIYLISIIAITFWRHIIFMKSTNENDRNRNDQDNGEKNQTVN